MPASAPKRKTRLPFARRLTCLALSAALVLLALSFAPPPARADGEPLGGCLSFDAAKSQYRVTRVVWQGKKPGETMIAYAIVNVEDAATVCGFFVNKGAVPGDVLGKMLALGRIASGNQTVMKGLSYFNDACAGGKCKLCGKCTVTPHRWKSAYQWNKPQFVPGVEFKGKLVD